MGCGSSSNPAAGVQAQQQQQQANTNQAVSSINSAFSGFTPQFYQGVQDAYTNYAMPQLQQQYQTANNQLGYKLAGQGLLNSSAAQQGTNALSGAMQTNQNQLANAAVGQANQMKQTVGQEQSNLIGQAQTATDPAALGTQALALASSTTAPSTFAPVGQLFSQFGQQYLANQNSNMYNNFANQYLSSLSNPGIFGANSQTGSSNALPGNVY